ncbi:phage regulatory CII family protein [Acidovorax sp. JG5]|uniref:phage regulatory CII family protein n=1 Tax=Acidovorax sp. JG5 TaxID=2822718 RepID=UPI001B3344EE|nr:phage regulatory CII family protein [Acidovorax sp. JG5]MBP3980856.1 phage regulatory CII family protein [Acidovorax sp. JG5]
MSVSFSIPPAAAYGDNEALPDMPAGLTVEDAIYHTVHGHPGGVAALAARMGVSPNTLTHKANPNNTTHHLHPRELVALQHMSGNAAVLHAMASQLGYTCTLALPDQACGCPVEATMRLQVAFAELLKAVADPLARCKAEPGKPVTGNEVRRADYYAQDLHAAIGHVLGTLRAHARPAPVGV